MASDLVSRSRARKDTLLSRRFIEGLIADGRHVIIFDNRVLKVDAWIKFHPGGDKAIKHMVGRDATDEINAYAIARMTGCRGLTCDSQTGCTRKKPASECYPSKLAVLRECG